MTLDSDVAGAWLTREEMDSARQRLPILYVDAVPVRVDEAGEVTQVGLLLRADSEGNMSRALVSGRVLYGERVRQALVRHLEKDLGPLALPRIPASPQPFTVAEYFPVPGITPFHDARQHAVSLAFVIPVEGDCQPRQDALEITWLTPNDARDDGIRRDMVGGQSTLLLHALAHVGGMTVTFRLTDRPRRLARVRLAQEIGLPDVEFARVPGAWELVADVAGVLRMEYLYELTDHNGNTWTIRDPGNPRRAPSAFGEKSVLELSGYVPPPWLQAAGTPAELTSTEVPGPGGVPMSVQLWTPEGLDGPAPLLLVHDGPEFASLGGFTSWLAAMIATGELPPARAALLDPGDRNDWYAANAEYAAAVAALIPTLPATSVIGVGASLGALAMLHLHQLHPLDALFLQSGSFFTPRLDEQESTFSGFGPVTGFVSSVAGPPVRAVLTCGAVEENLANNRAMASTLTRLGYDVVMHEVPDAHNFTAWRDALHPYLTELVRAVRRDHVHLNGADLIAYGHWGRPVLMFPAEAGRAWDLENNGIVDAVAGLIEGGRIKLYCVDSADAWTWSARDVPLEERAQRHGVYERWVLDTVVPWIVADSGGTSDLIAVGASLGAYHAANFALKHANVFPVGICLSGNYDPTTWHAWGEPGDATYFNNPFAYVPNLGGDHLDWLRAQVSLLLVVGQGAWEVDPTQSLPSTRAFAAVLAGKGIRHELDVWGHDVPHDWPSWQRQLAHHLPRFC